MTDLKEIVDEGDLAAVRAKLAEGADPDSTDDDGISTLLTVARRPWAGRDWNPPSLSVEMSKLLIDAGADVNATSTWGWTPLAWAVVQEDVPLVELLVGRGARSDVPIKEDLADAGLERGMTARDIVERWAEDAEDDDDSAVQMLAILNAAGHSSGAADDAETSFLDGHPPETRAVLIYGYRIEDAPLAAIEALWTLATRTRGVQLVAATDVDNTDEDDWEMQSVFLGVAIHEARGEDGDHERAMGFDELRARVDGAASVVGGLADRMEAFKEEYAHATVAEPQLALVCSGWLASAILCKGEWLDLDPDEDGPEPEDHHGYKVRLRRGTEGSSQDTYEAGGVHGIVVAADSFDGNAYVEITLDPDEDARMNEALQAAGISGRDYYVLSQYD